MTKKQIYFKLINEIGQYRAAIEEIDKALKMNEDPLFKLGFIRGIVERTMNKG